MLKKGNKSNIDLLSFFYKEIYVIIKSIKVVII